MPTAEEIQEVLPGCYIWQAFCSQAKVLLTSHAIVSSNEFYLVDPIRLSKNGLEQLAEVKQQPTAVLLTNGNHERDAAFYRDYFSIPVFAHPEAAKEFSFATEGFPQQLGSLEIISLPGAGIGEIGIYDRDKKMLCLGDMIINLDSFPFAPLPNKYATNKKQMRKSIASLTALNVRTICFAHGLPVTMKAMEKIEALITG